MIPEVVAELIEVKEDIQTNLCFGMKCEDCPFFYGKDGCEVADFIDNHIEDYRKRTEGVKD